MQCTSVDILEILAARLEQWIVVQLLELELYYYYPLNMYYVCILCIGLLEAQLFQIMLFLVILQQIKTYLFDCPFLQSINLKPKTLKLHFLWTYIKLNNNLSIYLWEVLELQCVVVCNFFWWLLWCECVLSFLWCVLVWLSCVSWCVWCICCWWMQFGCCLFCKWMKWVCGVLWLLSDLRCV